MIEMTGPMRELAARSQLDTVTSAELPPRSRALLDAGWFVDAEGAWLLRALQGPNGARRENRVDMIGWEAAANGRVVYDLDLDPPSADDERAIALLRRGFALVQAVMHLPRPGTGSPVISGALGLSLSDSSSPTWSAHYWFWAEHDGEAPYFQVHDSDDSLLMIIRS